MKNIKSYQEFINESTATSLSPSMGGYDDKEFLKIAFSMSLDELNTLLDKSKNDLKWLNANSRGILGTFNRKDAQWVKTRMTLIKDVIKNKKKDPEFIPDWLKESRSSFLTFDEVKEKIGINPAKIRATRFDFAEDDKGSDSILVFYFDSPKSRNEGLKLLQQYGADPEKISLNTSKSGVPDKYEIYVRENLQQVFEKFDITKEIRV